MKKLSILFAISTLLLLNACNVLKIKHHQDETIDFSKYKTFSFFGWTDASGENINEFDKKRIEQSFAAEFKKRGLEYIKDKGDLVVSLFIQIDKEFNTVTYINHYNMGGYGYYGYIYTGFGWGVGTIDFDTQDYHEGTLFVDVFDSQTKKIVWQVIASRTLNESAAKREKKTPKAVASMMQSFPIKKK
jgi:hypothetical protein